MTILTRKTGGNKAFADEWKKKGARIHAVDYDDEASLVEALSGVQVVISTLGPPGSPLQVSIVKAAKKAGVELYVNGHWGPTWTAADVPELAMLDALRAPTLKVAEEVDLPWVDFRTGAFPEYCFLIPAFGLTELKKRKAFIYGNGNAQNSWTTQTDIVRYVLYVLRHLPLEQLGNRRFNIQGDLKSLNEIVTLYEAKYPGPSVDVTYSRARRQNRDGRGG